MKVLYDWLKEFVDVQLSPAELRERLSLAGIAVEGVSDTPAGPMLDADLTINRPDLPGALRHGAGGSGARSARNCGQFPLKMWAPRARLRKPSRARRAWRLKLQNYAAATQRGSFAA